MVNQNEIEESSGWKSRELECEVPTEYGFGIRHTQSIIIFFSMIGSFMVRTHLGVTIVAMTSSDGSSNSSNTSLNTSDTWDVLRVYDWRKSVQEMVLSSFNLGYIIMTLPLSAVCQKWGGKIPVQIALIINGISSIPIPWLVVWGDWKALCVCRIVQGASQAGMTPAISSLIAHWVPLSERARFFSCIYTGSAIGIVIGFQMSGLLSTSSWGWPSVFWVTGLLNLTLFAVVTYFVSPTPSQNKHITVNEKNFILGRVDTGLRKRRKTPWRAIATSKPLWASFAGHVGSGTTYGYCFNQVASYLHHALGVNIQNSGLLSSLPYIATTISSVIFGTISDFTINKNIISVQTSRFLFNSIAQVGVAICIMLVSFTTSTTLAVICFIFTFIFFGAGYSGGMLGYVDMSPNYAGALMGSGNTLMCACLLVTPALVSHIITDMTNLYQWRIMFFIMAGVSFVGNLIYVVFGSAEIQPWNDGYEAAETDEKNQTNNDND